MTPRYAPDYSNHTGNVHRWETVETRGGRTIGHICRACHVVVPLEEEGSEVFHCYWCGEPVYRLQQKTERRRIFCGTACARAGAAHKQALGRAGWR